MLVMTMNMIVPCLVSEQLLTDFNNSKMVKMEIDLE